MNGWETKTIGDVCTIVNGGTPKTGVSEYWDGEHLWITPAEMGKRPSPYAHDTARKLTDKGLQDCSARLLPPHSVILSSRAPIGHLVINTAPMATNQGCKGLIPGRALDHKYLFYFLGSVVDHLNDLGTGATFKELSGAKLKEVAIPLPPLDEQRGIVAILDEAFTGVAVMRQHAEANLKNARNLFDSHLNAIFSQSGDGWVETTLGAIADFKNGLNYTQTSKGEKIRIVGVKDFQNHFWMPVDGLDEVQIDGALPPSYELQDDDILTVRSNGNKQLIGRCILARGVSGKASHSGFTIRIRVTDRRVNPVFLTRYLKSDMIHRTLIESGDGANISSLNQKALTALPVNFPEQSTQQRIVAELDEVEASTAKLQTLYRQKLAAIDELKQSVLHRAFSGALIREASTAIAAQATAQHANDNRRNTAMVLALAFARHQRANRDRSFGHVKAQKILHMVEAEAGFDLGRAPRRAAAGPNDFPHMLACEDWAVATKHFSFRKSGEGYTFKPLSNFDDLIKAARAIEPVTRARIERIIDFFIPMDMQQSEVFATVYAAWNNLLIEGKPISDDTIISAAREEWHPNKLKIDRVEFVKALRQLRDKNCTPSGQGKFVQPSQQADLFA